MLARIKGMRIIERPAKHILITDNRAVGLYPLHSTIAGLLHLPNTYDVYR